LEEGIVNYVIKCRKRSPRRVKRYFSQVLEDIKKGGKNWQKIKKERVWEIKIRESLSISLYKTDTMLEETCKWYQAWYLVTVEN
jgi:hypothetical protein